MKQKKEMDQISRKKIKLHETKVLQNHHANVLEQALFKEQKRPSPSPLRVDTELSQEQQNTKDFMGGPRFSFEDPNR